MLNNIDNKSSCSTHFTTYYVVGCKGKVKSVLCLLAFTFTLLCQVLFTKVR